MPNQLDADMLFDLFAFSSEKARQRRKENFVNKAIAIKDILHKTFSYEELVAAFKKDLKKDWALHLHQWR